ncbi:hypothetical protein BO99DRAFT_427728 [Aspergillus violaceofuscus CBS 115571]|uniref:Uncharacterized protein n=1 Tax=Aspergillus violaceofuscus (strain CBS 115571) TaxID=1450538 RepID=A0A2V5HJX3_ASPV1|nr:hypothetical protein BO99DRAFT_427728 [Aspergillus violaceofuscus CBS 115571]
MTSRIHWSNAVNGGGGSSDGGGGGSGSDGSDDEDCSTETAKICSTVCVAGSGCDWDCSTTTTDTPAPGFAVTMEQWPEITPQPDEDIRLASSLEAELSSMFGPLDVISGAEATATATGTGTGKGTASGSAPSNGADAGRVLISYYHDTHTGAGEWDLYLYYEHGPSPDMCPEVQTPNFVMMDGAFQGLRDGTGGFKAFGSTCTYKGADLPSSQSSGSNEAKVGTFVCDGFRDATCYTDLAVGTTCAEGWQSANEVFCPNVLIPFSTACALRRPDLLLLLPQHAPPDPSRHYRLYGAGQRTVLEHISETPIRPFILQGQHYIGEEGSSPLLGLALRMVDVGGDAPGHWHVLTAQSYADVGALIVVVDVADPITLNELREELGRVVRGRRVQGRTEPFPVAKPGIPWLVLVIFKGEVVDEEIAREQVAALHLNELSVDWVFRPVAAGDGKGIKQSVSWLTKRLEENTKHAGKEKI